MKPNWYKKRVFGGRGNILQDTPEQRGCCRSSYVVKGLAETGKYPYGLTSFKVEGKYNRDYIEKRIQEGLYTLVRVIPAGRHYRFILASTRKAKEKELAGLKERVEELEEMLS
jgi:hypothetical protein